MATLAGRAIVAAVSALACRTSAGAAFCLPKFAGSCQGNSIILKSAEDDLNPFHDIDVGNFAAPQALDWDGDGDLDLLIGNQDGELRYFERLADSSLRPRDGPELNPFHDIDVGYFAAPQALDWDGDGDLDLLIGNGDGELLYFEQGQCDVRPMCYNRGMCDHLTATCGCLTGYTSSTCLACSAGYHFGWAGDLPNCKACGRGQSSAGGSTATCTPCGQGNASAGNGSVCMPCSAGRIPTPDHAACVRCGPGRAPSEDGEVCIVPREVLLAFAVVLLVVVCGAAALCRQYHAKLSLAQAIEEQHPGKLRGALERGRALGVNKDVVLQAADVLDVCDNKYIDQRFLIGAVRDGHLKLLKGSWLVAQTDRPRFKRQQDLPPAAFWTAEDLIAEQRFILWIAVSYCWLHPVHPDPNGKHFKTLCHAIRLRRAVGGPGMVEDVALFLDYCSLAQNGERGSLSDPEPGTTRSAEEGESFRRGLRQVNILYAHQFVEVWKMQWVPEEEPRKYMTRGWPFFEQAVAGLIKDSTRLLSLEPSVQSSSDWLVVSQGVAASRSPPMQPDAFEEEVRKKTFTNASTDADFVVHKYRETFEDVVGKAPTLWFSRLKWADKEAREVADLLPRCGSLQRLIVRSNAITAQGVMALVKAAKGCPSLKAIDLSENPIEVEHTEAIYREWERSGKARERLILGQPIPGMERSAGHAGQPAALDAPTVPLLEDA